MCGILCRHLPVDGCQSIRVVGRACFDRTAHGDNTDVYRRVPQVRSRGSARDSVALPSRCSAADIASGDLARLFTVNTITPRSARCIAGITHWAVLSAPTTWMSSASRSDSTDSTRAPRLGRSMRCRRRHREPRGRRRSRRRRARRSGGQRRRLARHTCSPRTLRSRRGRRRSPPGATPRGRPTSRLVRTPCDRETKARTRTNDRDRLRLGHGRQL